MSDHLDRAGRAVAEVIEQYPIVLAAVFGWALLLAAVAFGLGAWTVHQHGRAVLDTPAPRRSLAARMRARTRRLRVLR